MFTTTLRNLRHATHPFFLQRWINRLPHLVLVLAFPITLTSVQAEDLPKTIRFGEVGSASLHSVGGKPAGTGLVPLAIELGFFDQEFGKEGPKIETDYFSGTGPAINEALAQNEIDFGSYGGLPNVIGLAGGIPAHIVATRQYTTASYYFAVRSDSPIKSIDDLRGKRITVQKGTNPYQELVLFLATHGIAEKDVTIVNLQGAEAVVAFNAGAVDAVFGGTNLLILQDQGKARIVANTKGFQFGGTSGFLVNNTFEKTYPEAVARVVKVLTKTAWWASEESNREQLLKFISDRSYSLPYIEKEYEGSLRERYSPLINEASITSFADTVKFAAEHKLIRKEVDESGVRGWFEPQYQQAALKELKLDTYWTAPGSPAVAAPAPKTTAVTTQG